MNHRERKIERQQKRDVRRRERQERKAKDAAPAPPKPDVIASSTNEQTCAGKSGE
jgi:hypothetical protein